jgi:hypothetical protein
MKVRGRLSPLQRPQHHLQHPVQVRPHIFIPKSKNFNAQLIEVFIAPTIVSLLPRFTMYISVQFDRQQGFGAIEIQDIWPVAMLTAKPITSDASISQAFPQRAFSPSRVSAQDPS